MSSQKTKVSGKNQGKNQPTGPDEYRAGSENTPAPLDPLTNVERMGLGRLGYKREHLDAITPHAARIILETKTYRHGSEAYMRNVARDPMTGAVGLSESDIARFSDEAVDQRIETEEQPYTSVLRNDFQSACLNASEEEFAVTDELNEYKQVVVKGTDQLNGMLRAFAETDARMHGGKRTRRFRLIDPTLPSTMAGPQYQPVRYERGKLRGKIVENGPYYLGQMPLSVHQEHYAKPIAEQTKVQGKLDKVHSNPEDRDLAIGPEEAGLVPIRSEMRGQPSGVFAPTRDPSSLQSYTDRGGPTGA